MSPSPTVSDRMVLVFCLCMTLAVLAPIAENFRSAPRDGFPFSPYRMFTKVRRDRLSVYHAVGRVRAEGRVNLPVQLLGAGGMNQVRKRLRRAVHQGAAPWMCEDIARTVAGSSDPAWSGVYRVDVVRSRYPVTPASPFELEPISRRVYASCPVSRSPFR